MQNGPFERRSNHLDAVNRQPAAQRLNMPGLSTFDRRCEVAGESKHSSGCKNRQAVVLAKRLRRGRHASV